MTYTLTEEQRAQIDSFMSLVDDYAQSEYIRARRALPPSDHEPLRDAVAKAAIALLQSLPVQEAQPVECVGWQFRYVFEDQDNRRDAWSTVLEGEPMKDAQRNAGVDSVDGEKNG
jgi:hypothetical protein